MMSDNMTRWLIKKRLTLTSSGRTLYDSMNIQFVSFGCRFAATGVGRVLST
jgi:hypothetical protein